MTARIRCNKCEAESYYDGKTKIYCLTCFAQLEAEIGRLDKAFDWSAQKYAQLEAKNERLRELFRAGHEMDEGRTWFWDDDIVKALRGK